MTTPIQTIPARQMADLGLRRVPTNKVELYTLPGFLPPELCQRLITLIDQDRRPSPIADANGDPFFRTSETCDLSAAEPAVQGLEQRLFALNGLDPRLGEPVQGQRYEVGQEFKPHTDYFEPNGVDYFRYCSVSGQRTWTFMIYLNDVEAGGGTRFKLLDKIIRPELGKLLCWYNRLRDGSVNPATLHHGMKVRRGVKYIITKWYRERPWA